MRWFKWLWWCLLQHAAAEEWYVCPMTSAIATGGQCEVPEGVQMLWEAELGAASQTI